MKTECQHFLDCIRTGTPALTGGCQGLDVVRILEAASTSLKNNGAPVSVSNTGPRKRPSDRAASTTAPEV